MAEVLCRRCLLRDGSEEDLNMLKKYVSVIKPADRAGSSVTETRLRICQNCEHLVSATCLSCGCYVEFRAALKNGRCPKKKW